MNRNEAQLQFDTLSIEGGLFSAEWLGKVASFKAPGQTDADYAVRAGFSTREEIAFAWRSAQHLWGQFKAARQPSGADTWAVTQRFVSELLRQSFGFTNSHAAEHPEEIDGRAGFLFRTENANLNDPNSKLYTHLRLLSCERYHKDEGTISLLP